MHVQMEHRLPRTCPVVDHDSRPVFVNSQLLRDVGGRHEKMSEQALICRRRVTQRRDLPLGNHQEVRRSLRRDIVKRHAVFVIVKDLRWDFPTKDASEDVRRIVCQRVLMRRRDLRNTDNVDSKPLHLPGSSPGRRRKCAGYPQRHLGERPQVGYFPGGNAQETVRNRNRRWLRQW